MLAGATIGNRWFGEGAGPAKKGFAFFLAQRIGIKNQCRIKGGGIDNQEFLLHVAAAFDQNRHAAIASSSSVVSTS